MLHYNSLRKYTLGLLSTFNDIEVAYLASDGVSTLSKKIPIAFSSREKATLFDKVTTQQLLSGNYNVLPRMSLVLTSMIKSEQRVTNKFTKHNIQDVDGERANFNYNAVPYEYMYEIVIQCRGMNEASMIIEQIAPRFNPTYTMRINEIPGATEATSVPVQLLDISIESEEYEDISTNIVNVNIGLGLKGNLYPPLQTQEKVLNYKIYNNIMPNDDEFQRTSLAEWDVVDTLPDPGTHELTTFMGLVVPNVTDITGTANVGDNILEAIYDDKDNQYQELTFTWVVEAGDATVTTGDYKSVMTLNSGTSADIRITITDVHGNSDTLVKTIGA